MIKRGITITVLESDSKQTVEAYPGEYRNLMELLRNKLYLDDFGECGGMGRCATCIVKVSGMKGNSLVKERNEPITLSRFGYKDEPETRLSCQILTTSDLDGATITILE